MTNQEVFIKVLDKIQQLVVIAHRKNWAITREPLIGNPARIEEIENVEKQIDRIIPGDLKELFLLSRHVEFSYQFDETLSEEFRQNFGGEIYWNLDTLAQQYADFQLWIEALLDPKYNDLDTIETGKKLWQNKLPIVNVPNGDIIAIGSNPSEVIYFSHEGDSMHGKIIGNSLWSFLDFYSRIGFTGSEDWQLEPFFDFEMNKMITEGEKVEKYWQLLAN